MCTQNYYFLRAYSIILWVHVIICEHIMLFGDQIVILWAHFIMLWEYYNIICEHNNCFQCVFNYLVYSLCSVGSYVSACTELYGVFIIGLYIYIWYWYYSQFVRALLYVT